MSDNEVDFSLFVRREFPTRFYAKGDTIFKEGEQADEWRLAGGSEKYNSLVFSDTHLCRETAFRRTLAA